MTKQERDLLLFFNSIESCEAREKLVDFMQKIGEISGIEGDFPDIFRFLDLWGDLG